jgi:sarcosine oxidase
VTSVAVAGLGAMGSAVAYHLARRGVEVTGLDRFRPPHTHGSSHGESRIIREAYYEHPAYVPLVRRAWRCWRDLEVESGRRLLAETGALMIGTPDGELVTGARRSAKDHGVPHRILDDAGIRAAFPQLEPRPGDVAVHETRAGYLRPEACIEAHLDLAVRHGAELRFHEPLTGWRSDGAGVVVRTSTAEHRVDVLVLATGAWLPSLVPQLDLLVERQVVAWFRPRGDPGPLAPSSFPVFIWEADPQTLFYGVPDLGSGVKVARHHGGRIATSPDDLPAAASDDDLRPLRRFVRSHIPAAAGPVLRTSVCRYTNTRSRHFLIGRHPTDRRVWVISACSGHGFKFASAIGAGVASELTTGHIDPLLRRFRLGTAV